VSGTFSILPRFLLRAPLLPVRNLRDGASALRRHPLGAAAIEVASPDLSAALASRSQTEARAALDRYARRAAFRATPAGLLAGVAVGRLGARTSIHTDETDAHISPTWESIAALGRALLDDPEVRPFVRLRSAPSLVAGGGQALWLALHDDGLQVDRVEVDDDLASILRATVDWIAWTALRERAHAEGDDEIDQWLLTLIDRGLVHHDLTPPLVGRSAGEWMAGRLARLPNDLSCALLDPLRAALSAGHVAQARAALSDLPGERASVQAVLRHHPRQALLSRRAVERAAELAPWLFRLQEALAGPVAERSCDGALTDSLATIAEVFGAGALDVTALATGGFGQMLAETEEERITAQPAPGLVGWLAQAVLDAARSGVPDIELDRDSLESLLPAVPVPDSFELHLGPAREPRRAPPGTGWLLGLHGPAGASWGRFAHALGDDLRSALADLAATEVDATSGQDVVDVAFAPSASLADLCAHPPVRRRALALAGWPEGDAITPAEMSLVADGERLALQDSDGRPLSPRPLHRVRSTTAPAGLFRLLAGWSFSRQHAPWAFSWGPLAGLDWLPRVIVDGFVIAPASWRIPDWANAADFTRWRKGLPRIVQVGQGDELLPVDLQSAHARDELRRFAGQRAYEVWPPLDNVVDLGGRRVEAVVSVVARSEAPAAAARIPSPAEVGPTPGWLTFKLFGPSERQHVVLSEAIAPVVQAARAAGEIDGWFFLPYLEGRRHHLRVRAHTCNARSEQAFTRRLRAALEPLAALVVAVETAPYFRESARYGGDALMPAVERIFEAGSDLALARLEAEAVGAEVDEAITLVRAYDALGAGLGLDAPARRALAQRRRAACQRAGLLPDDEWLRREYRRLSRPLAGALSRAEADILFDALAAYTDQVRSTASPALHAALPALLHMQAVRLAGLDPQTEAAAYVFWDRALESLAAQNRK
jgi:thiopeptide-type bacteriocin biosynthesis protein